MKIAVLGTRGFPGVQGGVEAHCQNLYPRLVKLGCEVTVFAREPYLKKGDSPQMAGTVSFFYQGVKIVPLACPKQKFLEAFVHTFRGVFAARRMKPDILHIHAVGPALMVPLAKMLGMRVVMTHHGPDYERAKWNWAAKMILRQGERNGVGSANAVICVSEAVAGGLRARFKREIIAIPNGVEVPRPVATDMALKRFGVEDGKYVLAVGRFVPEKGFGDLIRAFGIASGALRPRNDTEGRKLVIVGDADHEDKYSRGLKEAAAKNPNIVLTGYLSGMPLQELYSHAGIFVLPSYYEGLPIVLLEAMSYGLSCIASDIPANREVGLPEERFFRAGEVEALAAKISEYARKPISEEEKRAQIKRIAEKYDWDKIARQTLEVYKRVTV